MIRSAILAIVLPVLLGGAGRASANGTVKLTMEQRHQAAVDFVTRDVEKWVPSKQKLIVRGAQGTFPGNSKNPVTGDGLFTVYVKQKLKERGTFRERLRHRFSPYNNRAFVVNVSETGEAEILDQTPISKPYKLKAWLGKAVPVKKIVHDTVASGKGSEFFAWMSAGGMGAAIDTKATLLAGGALLMKGGQVVVSAVDSQKQKRHEAVKTTEAWLDEMNTKQGAYPNLGQAYVHYKQELSILAPGSKAATLLEFATHLSGDGY